MAISLRFMVLCRIMAIIDISTCLDFVNKKNVGLHK